MPACRPDHANRGASNTKIDPRGALTYLAALDIHHARVLGHDQPLSADRVFRELKRIRQVTFDADGQTITSITHRDPLQQILAARDLDTRTWNLPVIHG